jgi:hypothetical protein
MNTLERRVNESKVGEVVWLDDCTTILRSVQFLMRRDGTFIRIREMEGGLRLSRTYIKLETAKRNFIRKYSAFCK